MVDPNATDQEIEALPDERPRTPGLVLAWTAGVPISRGYEARTPLLLGRDADQRLQDTLLSRRHAEVCWHEGRWHVRDVGSSNGTYVDGERLAPSSVATTFDAPRVLRLGHTVFFFEPDLARLDGREDLREADGVEGPALRRVMRAAVDAAEGGKSLHVVGESGTGKERVAERYYHKGPRVRGELVSLNCAAIPKDLAESLLFGAERGAHSGAHKDALGLVRKAHRGVLFLDEVAELVMEVQAKLLRVLETKTVLPLGATSPAPADFAVVSATNADVRAAVGQGRFRHDLIPRLLQREVHIPALWDRPEEIPFLIDLERRRQAGAPAPSARFVEWCMVRRWPLNVRDLFIAVDRAAAEAREAGAKELEPEAPRARSGVASVAPRAAAGPPAALPGSVPPPAPRSTPLEDVKRAEIVAAYKANGFDASKTAKALGISRATLYRWLERFGLK
jgi:DNA-binding NtrC family response regulator